MILKNTQTMVVIEVYY